MAISSTWHYGFYTILRFAVTAAAIFIAYCAFELRKQLWIYILILVAIAFNPIILVHFDKDTWTIIDIVVATIYLISIFALKPKSRAEK
jgi:hypothetical protein